MIPKELLLDSFRSEHILLFYERKVLWEKLLRVYKIYRECQESIFCYLEGSTLVKWWPSVETEKVDKSRKNEEESSSFRSRLCYILSCGKFPQHLSPCVSGFTGTLPTPMGVLFNHVPLLPQLLSTKMII